jgi:hypothetical protein
MPKGNIVDMFTNRVCLSLMARTTIMMACLHARIAANQSLRDQNMRKEKCVRWAPEFFWEDADDQDREAQKR